MSDSDLQLMQKLLQQARNPEAANEPTDEQLMHNLLQEARAAEAAIPTNVADAAVRVDEQAKFQPQVQTPELLVPSEALDPGQDITRAPVEPSNLALATQTPRFGLELLDMALPGQQLVRSAGIETSLTGDAAKAMPGLKEAFQPEFEREDLTIPTSITIGLLDPLNLVTFGAAKSAGKAAIKKTIGQQLSDPATIKALGKNQRLFNKLQGIYNVGSSPATKLVGDKKHLKRLANAADRSAKLGLRNKKLTRQLELAKRVGDDELVANTVRELDRLEADIATHKVKAQKEIADPQFRALESAFDNLYSLEVEAIGQGDAAATELSKQARRMFKNAAAKDGVFVSASEARQLAKATDVSKFQAGAFSSLDIRRIAQIADNGAPRGVVMRSVIEPAIEKMNLVKVQGTELKQKLAESARDLGIQGDRNGKLWRAAQNETLFAQLSQNEQQFVAEVKNTYNVLLSQINKARRQAGLKEIRARQNYVTHLQELTTLDRIGITDPARFERAAKTGFGKKLSATFRFAKRQLANRRVKEDLFEAINTYIDPAMKQIHLTGAAKEVRAKSRFLPKNLGRAMENWVEQGLLGGLDSKDQFILEHGGRVGEIALNVGSFLSGITTRSILQNSLSTAVQQASQTIPTALNVGFGRTAQGLMDATAALAKGESIVPPEVLKKSRFLVNRSLDDEFLKIFSSSKLQKFDDFNNMLLGTTDKVFAQATWASAFRKGLASGLTEDGAVRYADDLASMLQAEYYTALRPALLRGRAARTVLPFQTFAFNLWNHVVRDGKVMAAMSDAKLGKSRIAQFMNVYAGMLATNIMYHGMGLPTPFPVPSGEGFDGEEPTFGAGVQAVAEAASINPLASSARFGFRPPAVDLALGLVGAGKSKRSNVFQNMLIAGWSDDFEKVEEAQQRLQEFGIKLLPGGNQALKTIKGVKAAQDGYYEIGDDFVDVSDLSDQVKAILLSPESLEGSKQIRGRERRRRINRSVGIEDDF